MTEMKKKTAKVLNQLICSMILLGIHHYLPSRTTSSITK
jgi:hypothetical protein